MSDFFQVCCYVCPCVCVSVCTWGRCLTGHWIPLNQGYRQWRATLVGCWRPNLTPLEWEMLPNCQTISSVPSILIMVRGVSFLICLCGVLNVFCIWTGNSFLNLGYFLFDSFEKHFPCLYTWVPSLFFYAYNPIHLTLSEYHMYLGISTGSCSLIYLWPCWSTSLSPLCLHV